MTSDKRELQMQLEQVNQAIASVLAGGQSYSIGGRQLTRANLSDLISMRNDLEGKLSLTQASHLLDSTAVAVFEGR